MEFHLQICDLVTFLYTKFNLYHVSMNTKCYLGAWGDGVKSLVILSLKTRCDDTLTIGDINRKLRTVLFHHSESKHYSDKCEDLNVNMTVLFTPFSWAPLSDGALEKYTNYVVKVFKQIGFETDDIQENDYGLPVVSELKARRLLEADTRLGNSNVPSTNGNVVPS